ncbi:MAG: hypothetical protein JWR03_1312 [Cohnella sp.]|nr:hypothetical protein [Cohnella sp.]
MAVMRPTPPRADSKKSRIVRTKAFPQPENISRSGITSKSGFSSRSAATVFCSVPGRFPQVSKLLPS